MIFYSVYADGDGEVMNRAYDFSSHPCDMRLMKGDKREKKAQQIHWASFVAFIGPCNHSTKRLQIHWAKLSYHPSIHWLTERRRGRANIWGTLLSHWFLGPISEVPSTFHLLFIGEFIHFLPAAIRSDWNTGMICFNDMSICRIVDRQQGYMYMYFKK